MQSRVGVSGEVDKSWKKTVNLICALESEVDVKVEVYVEKQGLGRRGK